MHYFIDQNQLATQELTDSYGVDSVNISKYNVTSKFQLTASAKAFACQDGMMIVQQSSENENLVNMILKPIKGLKIAFNSVKYYIYRVISKDSLFTGTAIKSVVQAPSNSFLERFWIDVDKYKTNMNLPNLAEPTPKVFGFDDSLSNTLLLEKIFDNSQTDTNAIYVKEGEWIGDFGILTKIGFEIILETDNLNTSDFNNQLDLNYLRKGSHQIDVTRLTGFEKRAKQELILSYIDPCAFFGLHFETGVDISVFAGNNKTLENKKKNDLYTLLLEKFATKNRVYLDIRSEKGYSYNFYQNYKNATNKNIKIGNSTTSPIEQVYESNSWPIVTLNLPINTTKHDNDVKFNLRIDDNLKPILFVKNKNLLGSNNNACFLDETRMLNGTNIEWSKDINLFFPNTGTVVSKKNVSYYLKLYYFRQEYNGTLPNTVLKNQFYFESAFAPIDLENIADVDYTFQHCFNSNVSYTSGILPNVTSRFGFVGETGVNWDANRILFYNKAIFKNHRTGKFFNPVISKTSTGFSLEGNFNKTSFLSKRIALNVNTLQEIVSTGVYNPVKVLDIIKNDDFSNAYEDLLCFGITQAEFTILKNLTGFTRKHHRYIYLEEVVNSPFNDKDNKVFKKFEVKIQGLDNNGNRLIAGATTPIYTYSQNGLVFASKEFVDIYSLLIPTDSQNLNNFISNNDLTGLVYTMEEKRNLSDEWFKDNINPPRISNKKLLNLDGTMYTKITVFKNELDTVNATESAIEDLIKLKAEEILNYSKNKIKATNTARINHKNKDGILYLTRLMMQVILRNHPKIVKQFYNKIDDFYNLFEKHSRGLEGAEKPNFTTSPNNYKKVLITGFDPFSGGVDKDKHHSNSSGNLVLALDNEIIEGSTPIIIKSAILPVGFKEFDNGWIESFFQPYILDNTIDMIITFSLSPRPKDFKFDRFAANFREKTEDNNNFTPLQENINIDDSLYIKEQDSFILNQLPFAKLTSNDKLIIPSFNVPSGSLFPTVGVFHRAEWAIKAINNSNSQTEYVTKFHKDKLIGDFESKPNIIPPYDNYYVKVSKFNDPDNQVSDEIKYFTNGNPDYIPFPNWVNYSDLTTILPNETNPWYQKYNNFYVEARKGSGGNFLSNELHYRVAYLRKKHNPTKKTGHIHINFMDTNSDVKDRDVMISAAKEIIKKLLE